MKCPSSKTVLTPSKEVLALKKCFLVKKDLEILRGKQSSVRFSLVCLLVFWTSRPPTASWCCMHICTAWLLYYGWWAEQIGVVAGLPSTEAQTELTAPSRRWILDDWFTLKKLLQSLISLISCKDLEVVSLLSHEKLKIPFTLLSTFLFFGVKLKTKSKPLPSLPTIYLYT